MSKIINRTLFEKNFGPYGQLPQDVNIDEIIDCFRTSGYYDVIKNYLNISHPGLQLLSEKAGLSNGADYLVCRAIFYLNLLFNVNNGIHPTPNGPINLLPQLKEDYRKLQITNTEIENYLNSKYWLRPHRDMSDIANNISINIRNLGDSQISDVLINLDAIKNNYRTSDGLISSIECIKMIKKLIECWMLLIVTIVPEVQSTEDFIKNTEVWIREQEKKRKGGKLIKSRKKYNSKNNKRNYKKKTNKNNNKKRKKRRL
jgi:hypothetical protein